MIISNIEDDKLSKIYGLRKDAAKAQKGWRDEYRESCQFRAGDQWSDDDKAALEEMNRPCITFNRVAPIIDSVSGYEINNRREVRYRPRTEGDRGINQVYTETAQYVRDACDAEDEESESYTDAITGGMGWTETKVDYDEDPDGVICIERVPPLEMRWDPASRKGNLADANWVMREKWWTVEDIKEAYPHVKDIEPSADMMSDEAWNEEHDATNAWKYQSDAYWFDPKEGKALVIQYQYRDHETYYRVGSEGRAIDFSESRFKRLKKRFDQSDTPYVKLKRWVYKQCIFVGETELEEGPCPIDDGFSFQAITGKRDEEKGWWYGMTRAMMDPQRFANAFFSQSIYTLQANSKGGVMYEESAVSDPRKFEDAWSDPAGMVAVEDGALQGGRIQPKPVGSYPPQLDRLMQSAISAIRDCTGVNMELLGSVGHEQTGILEQERKSAALTILAPLVNSLKRYRKRQGGILLSFIRTYMTAEQIQRITEREIPWFEDDKTVQYDVIVDDADNSPNLKTEVWGTMQNVLPAMMRAGVPIPPSFIRFSPLPDRVADEWVQYVEQKEQAPDIEPLQQQIQNMQSHLQKIEQENMMLKDKRQAEQMQLQSKERMAQLDAQLKQEDMALEMRRHEQTLMMKQQMSEVERNTRMAEINARYQTEMARIQEQSSTQKETALMQVATQRDIQVISIENEREKRAVEREDKLAKDINPHIDQIEETTTAVDEVTREFREYRDEMTKNREVILAFLESRGGEAAAIARKLH